MSELRDAHAAARLPGYIRKMSTRWSYVWYVSTNELRSRQMTSVLGNLWHLLNPMLQVFVYYLIFGLVLKVDRGVDNFMLFVTVGVFVFAFTQRVTMAGASSVVGNVGLITQISFPRAVLPLTSTVTESLATIPAIFVMYATAFLTGASPRWTWLFVPFVFAAQAYFNFGAALVAARATHVFRDFQQILPFVFRLLFFGSGIVFSIEAYTTQTSWGWVFDLNPVYGWVSIVRWAMLGSPVTGSLMVCTAVWTLVLPVLGFFWFKAGEESYGRT